MQGNPIEPSRSSARRANLAEGAALSASLLCLAHCLALPLLLLLLPGVLGLFVESEAFHTFAVLFVVPSALAAFWLGYLRHRALPPALLGVVGIACLGGALLPAIAAAATLLTIAGSLLLVAGHTLNWWLRSHAR